MDSETGKRSLAARLIFFLLIFFVCLGLIEIGARVFAAVKYGKITVSGIIERPESNAFVESAGGMSAYEKGLFPHPYLAFVHNKKFNGSSTNNIGLMFPEDMPGSKREDYFTILVLGGSVASQFAGLFDYSPRYLEKILNDRYDFQGKTVKVLSAADGAWKQPQQVIMLSLYGHVADAVVSLEGFNEHYLFLPGVSVSLELPAPNYWTVNPFLTGGAYRQLASSVEDTLAELGRENFIVRHSMAAYLLLRLGRTQIIKWCKKNSDGGAENERFGISTASIFTIPDSFREVPFEYNINLYKKYIRMMNAIADSLKMKKAFFMQPVPGLKKKLTPEELRVVGDLSYAPTYAAMEKELLSLTEEGVPVFSLVDVFEQSEETLYADSVHCVGGVTEYSEGHRLMAEKMAAYLEKEWKLERK